MNQDTNSTQHETEFKVLMHCGQYVDQTMLWKGIYPTNRPQLFNREETIESIIAEMDKFLSIVVKSPPADNTHTINKNYINHVANLRQCELVPVMLVLRIKNKRWEA